MLTFLCFKWRPFRGYRSEFDGETVNVLCRMIARNYRGPHRFVCVTDDPTGITEPGVEIFRLWDDFAHVPNPSNPSNPSCYRRLKTFARNAGEWLGDNIVCMDLDAVIVGPLDDLFACVLQPEFTFKIWRSATSHNPYNGSLWALRAGAHPEVWECFDPDSSPRETKRLGLYGSDQAWFAAALGSDMPVWTKQDGVLSFRVDIGPTRQLPPGARVVFFHGRKDPWTPGIAAAYPWVRECYR